MIPDSKTKLRLVLLDAHAILHRAYHALPEFSSSKGEPTGAIYGLSAMLIRIIGDLKPDYIAACYDLPGGTFRHEAYEGYKAGRKEAEPELKLQMQRSRDVFTAFSIPIYERAGFEADDILGTIVEQLKNNNDIEIIIASGDMDTMQLVSGKRVRVYTLRKGLSDTVLYDEAAVKKRFSFGPERIPDYKGLSGDPSDNIIGIKGIGEKTATTLVIAFGTIEEMYAQLKKSRGAFEKVGIKPRVVTLLEEGEEEALFSKVLATIVCDVPISFSLPNESWRKTVVKSKIKALFIELEFRSLAARVDVLLDGEEGNNTVHQKNAISVSTPAAAPENERREMRVMFSLVDSNVSDPTDDDLYSFAQSKNWQEAKSVLTTEIKNRELLRVFEEIEKPLIPVLSEMMRYGVLIDTKNLAGLSKDYHAKLAVLEKEIFEKAGAPFVIGSPKQLGEVLFQKLGLKAKNQKRTGTGALSTKESELEKITDLHPIVPLILEWRELSKLLTTYIDVIPKLCDKAGRLHTTFLQIGTATGRMASRDPNLQNIPNKTELGLRIREAFVAPKGSLLVSLDYSQIEFRIAAFLSQDEKLIAFFKRGEDIHTSVAAAVFGVKPEAVDKEMRRQAKVINFGVMYGMGVNALRQNLGTDRATAQEFYENYFRTFSGLAGYLEEVKRQAAKKGYTETFFGRRRYFSGLQSTLPFIRASAERMAINAPIQGTEADIIKLAMVRADAFIKKAGYSESAHLLLQVHDELVYEIKEPFIKTLVPRITDIMQSVLLSKETKGVPIIVDMRVGKNWGEMEKLL